MSNFSVLSEIKPQYLHGSMIVEENQRAKLIRAVARGDHLMRSHCLKNRQTFVTHGDTTILTLKETSIVIFKKMLSRDKVCYISVATNIASSANRKMQLFENG